MIKGTLFSKLLKLSLSTLLISCFILLGNFSSAVLCAEEYSTTFNAYDLSFNLNTPTTITNSLYESDFTLNYHGNLYTQSDDFNGKFFVYRLNNNSYLQNFMVFWNNGLPYSIATTNNNVNRNYYSPFGCIIEGDKVCDVISKSTCDNSNVIFDFREGDVNNDLVNSVYNLSDPDKVSFKGTHVQDGFMCYYYISQNKSLCFHFRNSGSSSMNSQLNGLGITSVNPADINNTLFEDSPWGSPSDGGSSSGGVQDIVVDNCTYSEIFNYLNLNGYNDYLCYGGLYNFDLYDSTITYNPVPGSGKTLGQILSFSNSWDTPNDWFVFWNGLYLDKNNSTFNSMWASYPAVYRTWFDLYYRYGGSTLVFDSVREYCAMRQLDLDFDNTFYKGQYFKNACNTIKMNYGTGDFENVVGVDWDGVGNHGTGSTVSNDPVVFIQNYFGKLKENFPTRYDLGGGFLPVYIITFLCAIVLFRFLSH